MEQGIPVGDHCVQAAGAKEMHRADSSMNVTGAIRPASLPSKVEQGA
jgi:hypothetical protein